MELLINLRKKITMRDIIKLQPKLGTIDVAEIHPDPKSRDEIDKISFGLLHIYSTPDLKEKVFSFLNSVIPSTISKKTGRPGMDLWQILVLAVFRNACNIDYDKLHNLANNHKLLRQLLGHSGEEIWSSVPYYHIQTIKDNVSLLTDDKINEINDIVVDSGHKLLPNKKKEELKCSVDSFVVLTDIHYPTDINLLYDSIRKAVELTSSLCQKYKITDLRQSKHNLRNVKRLLYKVQKSKHSGNDTTILERHHEYYIMVSDLLLQTRTALSKVCLSKNFTILDSFIFDEINKYGSYVEKQLDLIDRRVFKGEKIPNNDKIFSIFEPYTRWISKGKAGVFVEFGVPVAILKDQFGYILSHIVMETTSDVDVAASIIEKAKSHFTNIYSVSFDKGFWSPKNYETISSLIAKPIMPKKGRLSKAQKEAFDNDPEYKHLRNQHSSVESSINRLEHNGLDKCYDHGIDGFKRYTALGILACNLHNLGSQIMKKEAKKRKRKRKVKHNKAA